MFLCILSSKRKPKSSRLKILTSFSKPDTQTGKNEINILSQAKQSGHYVLYIRVRFSREPPWRENYWFCTCFILYSTIFDAKISYKVIYWKFLFILLTLKTNLRNQLFALFPYQLVCKFYQNYIIFSQNIISMNILSSNIAEYYIEEVENEWFSRVPMLMLFLCKLKPCI